MKTIPPGLQERLEAGLTTLASCWQITLADGAQRRFTDHDTDLVVDGERYSATASYTGRAVESRDDLSVSTSEVRGYLADIERADIEAGLYDRAEVRLFLVDWRDPGLGRIRLRRGYLGQISHRDGAYTAELRGLAQALQQQIGERTASTCRADLGDARCQVDLAAYTVTGTVTGVVDRAQFADNARGEAERYFKYGLLTWTGGHNESYSMEVKAFGQGVFTLVQAMAYPIAPGDTYSVYAGCDKLLETCIAKFDNVANNRSEPFVPGTDALLKFGGQT